MNNERLNQDEPDVVRILIYDPASQTFLLHVREPNSADALMPVLIGGTIEEGEEPINALKRELYEELIINSGLDLVKILESLPLRSKFRLWWSNYFIGELPLGADVQINDPEVFQLLRLDLQSLKMLVEGGEDPNGNRVPYIAFGHVAMIPLLIEKIEAYYETYEQDLAA